MFNSRVGFLADQMDLFFSWTKSNVGLATILEISNINISGTSRPINFVFDFRCLLSAVSEKHHLPAYFKICYSAIRLSSHTSAIKLSI